MENLNSIHKKALEVTGLDHRKTSPKGWIYGECPFCGDDSKFGLKLNFDRSKYKNSISFNCFRGSCKEHGTEYKLFTHFNVQHVLKQKEFISSNRLDLESTLKTKKEVVSTEELEVVTVAPPIGWKRVYEDSYLRKRGWDTNDFLRYKVGKSSLMGLQDYSVLLIEEENEIKGYVARSNWTSQQIAEYNAEIKRFNKTVTSVTEKKSPHSKYRNQGGVFFERLVFGLDDVSEKTEVVLLVEGPLDKTNTDIQLRLFESDRVKCGCTFGKKISLAQILRLKAKGVKNIVLLYDPDAIDASKQYSFELEKHFKVKIAIHSHLDPGEMKYEDFKECLSNSKSPIDFYRGLVGSVL